MCNQSVLQLYWDMSFWMNALIYLRIVPKGNAEKYPKTQDALSDQSFKEFLRLKDANMFFSSHPPTAAIKFFIKG